MCVFIKCFQKKYVHAYNTTYPTVDISKKKRECVLDLPILFIWAITFLFFIFVIVVFAAARPIQSPPYVNEKNVLSNNFIIFLLPTIADIGTPLDIAFAKAVKSGVTPVKS